MVYCAALSRFAENGGAEILSKKLHEAKDSKDITMIAATLELFAHSMAVSTSVRFGEMSGSGMHLP